MRRGGASITPPGRTLDFGGHFCFVGAAALEVEYDSAGLQKPALEHAGFHHQGGTMSENFVSKPHADLLLQKIQSAGLPPDDF